MFNALTVDVEDYFQVHAFSNVIKYEDWGNYECRVEHNTERILEILDTSIRNSQFAIRNSAKATFFVLGWIAERYPGLIRRIRDQGHEIACHGYGHKLIYTQSKEEFREDIRRAKAVLEDVTGQDVIGYRAPMYSITKKSQWALEILIEEGFKYDSSIFPIRHDFYGISDAPRFPFIVSLNGNQNVEFLVLNYELNTTQNSKFINQNSKFITYNSKLLIEFPISTVCFGRMNLPIAGGGYFRLFPYSVIKKGFTRINEVERQPFIFYIHPWEVDPDQPRINGLSFKSRFRHYINLKKTEERLKKLLRDFNFTSIKKIIERIT